MNQYCVLSGIFLAILGMGPRAFLTGKFSGVDHDFGKLWEILKPSKLIMSKCDLAY